MPRDAQARANTLAWLFAAYNSVEPMLFELGNVDIFASDEEWAKLRRPSLIEFIQGRPGRLNDAMGDKHYMADAFSYADIATNGRAPCRERVGQYVEIWGGRV